MPEQGGSAAPRAMLISAASSPFFSIELGELDPPTAPGWRVQPQQRQPFRAELSHFTVTARIVISTL